MNYPADNLSMLLSSDWFLPAWHFCGLQSEISVRISVQKGSRAVVESFVSGLDSYWEAEFSERREAQTKQQLEKLLADEKLTKYDQLVFKRFLDNSGLTEIQTEDMSLMVMLCSLLISEHGSGGSASTQFSSTLISGVSLALEAVESEINIVEQGSNVVTSWDKRLQDLTADLPSFLVDSARTLARCADGYAKFLAILRLSISETEYQRLLEWLNKTATELTGTKHFANGFAT